MQSALHRRTRNDTDSCSLLCASPQAGHARDPSRPASSCCGIQYDTANLGHHILKPLVDDLSAFAFEFAIIEFENQNLLCWIAGWSSRRTVGFWLFDDKELIAFLPFPYLFRIFISDRMDL